MATTTELRTLTIEADRYSAQITFKKRPGIFVRDGRVFAADFDVAAGCLGCDLNADELREIRAWIDEALASVEA